MVIKDFVSDLLRFIIKPLVGIIPKKKDLILFSAWFGTKYADNTRYLYEYMLKNTKYDIYWFTKNKDLYNDLREQGLPVIYSKTIKALWYQCRAKMLLSTVQIYDFNLYYLNNCYFLDLGHGFPGKPVGLLQPQVNERYKKIFKFSKKGLKYYETASSRFVVDYISPCYDVKPSNFIFSNKPRIDVLFDENLRKGINTKIDTIKSSRRLISYLPTHRSCGEKEMDITQIFDLKKLQSFCEQTNSVFLIKKHFYHRDEKTPLDEYPNIYDLTKEDLDTEVLLYQSDVLITDFSSCFIDYLALGRPILFYAYDYDDYMANERDYYWKYDMINGGYTAKNKDEFIKSLSDLSKDWDDAKHEEGRTQMRRLYFDDDVEMGTSRKKITSIIDELINGTYVPFNWNSKQ